MTTDEIAAVVLSLRISRGWSQTELATRAGVSRNCIAMIESRNERANSTIETLDKIFGALDLQMTMGFKAKKGINKK